MTCTGCASFSPSWKGLQHSPYGLPEKHGHGAEAAGILLDLIAFLALSRLAAGLFLSAPKPLASMVERCCLRQQGGVPPWSERKESAQGIQGKVKERSRIHVPQISLQRARLFDTCVVYNQRRSGAPTNQIAERSCVVSLSLDT